MATKRRITREVIPQSAVANKLKEEIKETTLVVKEVSRSDTASADRQTSEGSFRKERSKRVCLFCQNKSTPSYTELATLRRFLTDRAKIVGKERSGVCSKHQRAITKNIKYARHLALLPFVPKV